MKRTLSVALLCAALIAGAVPPTAAAYRSCQPVVNPYPDTRYEGEDLTGIGALGVSCTTARRVARGAHRRALGLPLPADGIRRFSWNGWRVRGDLRRAHDRYLAIRGSARVRWIF